jgi:hypothetical protein
MLTICGKEIWLEGHFVRVAHIDGEKYTCPDNLDGTLAGLRNSPERVDLFTFLQHPPDTTPKYSYPMEWDNLAVLPVSSFDHWWNHQIRSIGRNRARQAEKKAVVVGEVAYDGALLRGIVEIHNETPVRQGRRFPHYGMDLEGARRYAGTFLDRSIFLGARLGDQFIGFAKLTFNETRTHACVVNILSMLRHRDTAPTNALIAQAVRSCADRGISHLVYEQFTYGKRERDSLSQFKEVNGFRRMNLPRYFIPLTPLGNLALRAGLHHGFIDYCPEFIMLKFREIRTNWYGWKFRASLEAQAQD